MNTTEKQQRPVKHIRWDEKADLLARVKADQAEWQALADEKRIHFIPFACQQLGVHQRIAVQIMQLAGVNHLKKKTPAEAQAERDAQFEARVAKLTSQTAAAQAERDAKQALRRAVPMVQPDLPAQPSGDWEAHVNLLRQEVMTLGRQVDSMATVVPGLVSRVKALGHLTEEMEAADVRHNEVTTALTRRMNTQVNDAAIFDERLRMTKGQLDGIKERLDHQGQPRMKDAFDYAQSVFAKKLDQCLAGLAEQQTVTQQVLSRLIKLENDLGV